MADDKKISDLAVASTPLAGTELIEIVQGGVNKQTTASQFGGSVPDADASTKGIAKLNDTGSLGSATDAAPTQRAAKEYADTKSIKYEHFAASDETTGLTTGTGKVSFRMPYAGTLTAVRASLVAAQTSGSILTININKNGSTVLSTKLTIDNNAKTSVGATTPAVISVSSFADDDEVTVDIDQVGNGTAAGLKIKMYFS